MIRPSILTLHHSPKAQKFLYAWISFGFLSYLATWFFLRSSQQRTFFYLLVALPALCFSTRLYQLFKTNTRVIVSITLFIGYFSLSAYWGEGRFGKAIESGILTLCLLLAIEASLRRFGTEYLTNFIVIIAGVSTCTYSFAILLSDIELSDFIANRLSFYSISGWGSDNPIDTATVLGLSTLSAWWIFPGKKCFPKILLSLLIASSATLMLFTQSRTPLLTLALTLLIITLTRRDKSDIILMLFGCILLGLLFLFTNIGEYIEARITAPNHRIYIWQNAFAQFLDHFWIGSGFGRHARISVEWPVTHAHSFILETFRVGGVIGASLLFIMLFSMLNRFSLKPPGRFFLFWLIYGMLCLTSNGRLLLTKPWYIECFAFWIPLLCLYFSTRPQSADSASYNSENSPFLTFGAKKC
ncbi:MAG: O-antigen ligase family protein [Azoarcus sp.]|jgi:O-antigen ligase|nr:O-antigen ligase family protein [Azoarcus sp.]